MKFYPKRSLRLSWQGKALSWVAILLLLFSAKSLRGEEEPQAKLQWIDSSGSILDLDWPARTRWIWKQMKDNKSGEHSGAFAQISIDLPPNLLVELPKGSRARLLQGGALLDGGVDDEIESVNHATLIIDTQTPSFTEKLEVVGDGTANSQVGLAVTLNPSSPTILYHPSCVKEGLQLERVRGGGRFLFLAVHCRRDAKYLSVTFQTSQDADVVNSAGNILSRDDKIEALLPKNGVVNSPYVGEVRVASSLSSSTELYRVSWNGKPNAQTQEKNQLMVSSDSDERSQQGEFHLIPVEVFKNWTGHLGAGPGLVLYSENHTELTLQTWFRGWRPVGDQTETIKQVALDAEMPLIPITRNLLIPLASGPYSLSLGVQLGASQRSPAHGVTQLELGVRIIGMHTAYRADAPGFLLGPDLKIRFYFRVGVKKEVPWSTELRASFLGGSGIGPLFHGVALSARATHLLPYKVFARDLSLTFESEYIKSNRTDVRSVTLWKFMGGIQLHL